MYCIRSNQCHSFLGANFEARGTLQYVAEYLGRSPVKPSVILTILHAARKDKIQFGGSKADYINENNLRDTQWLITRILNRLHGMAEVADTQATSFVLGYDSFL